MQRLDNPYQYQELPSATPYGVGATNIVYLDRPRTIETLKVTQLLRNSDQRTYFRGDGLEKAGFKAVLYGEAHQISAGARRDTNTNQDVSLPSDTGWLLGSQLTFFTGARDIYVSLVLRHARGLAAYDPLSTPDSFANDRTTSGASETRMVLSANYESGAFGIAGAGYLRWFRDAGPAATSAAKYDEGNIAVRPQWYFAEHFGLAVEGSYQARRYALVNPDGTGPLTASLVRGAILPYFSPSGRGTFKRPMIGLLYLVTSRDAGARSLYPELDAFSQRKLEHYMGLTVEWWFNSSSYP
jgi:maltoporin